MLELTGEEWAYIAGLSVGGAIGIGFLSALFASAFGGNNKSRTRTILIVALTGAVAIGLYSFNEGDGDFTSIPSIYTVISYSISTLFIMALFSLRRPEPTSDAPEGKRFGGGRIIALLISLPIAAIGLGNLAGSTYVWATQDVPEAGWGISRAEMRDNMLNGDMAPFWQVLDERAPAEIDAMIERLFAKEAEDKSLDEFMQLFNRELVAFRVSLATYGPAMTDESRKQLIEANAEMLRQLEDRPRLCVEFATNGGVNLQQAELLTFIDEFNQATVIMTESLLDARDAATAGASMPRPPTEQDYEQLIISLLVNGMSENELTAVLNGDSSSANYCSTVIAFLEGVMTLAGPAGESVRFETVQGLLVQAP